MKNENGISEELAGMGGFLGGYSRKMPYSVPEGYFSGLADDLHNNIQGLKKPEIVPAWSKALPYSVPNGYFEKLTGDIVSMAVASDGVPALSLDPSYSDVPPGYFEALPARILQLVKTHDKNVKKYPKLIPFKRRKTNNPIRWAAAAVMVICVGLGSYEAIYSGRQPSHEKMLSSVTYGDLHEYLQHTYRLDVDKVVTNDINNLQVDPKDIIRYLNETGWDQTE